jgi:cytochrome c oxidase subunit 4
MASGEKHHIIPFNVYLKVLITLLILTALTVVASRFDFGAWNTVIAMLIASVKAGFVLAIFMHLKYDDKLYLVVIGTAVFFVIIFYLFPWVDIATRINQGSIL